MTHYVEVLIVDDQPRARQSLRALLSTWPPAAGIREAGDGNEAIQLVQERQPDIVLMDVRMPGMDGLQATRLIKARWPQIKVIVLTLYGEYEAEALAAGAEAFVVKAEPVGSLLATLLAVMAGRPHGRTMPEEVGDDGLGQSSKPPIGLVL
jgi:DNA-binding NarL/FixJ family response regulator